VKAFVLNYRFNGRERRYTIGQVPVWNIAQARAKAIELRRAIDSGTDPMDVRDTERATPMVADAIKRFEAEHYPGLRAATQVHYRGLIRKHIAPAFGARLVTAVTTDDMRSFYAGLRERHPVVARNVLILLNVLFGYVVKWGVIAASPAAGIKRERPAERARYLNSEELTRLLAVLDAHPCPAADIIRLLMFTGARKGETMTATWDQFDLVAATWTKPATATKQKKSHRVPLSDEAVTLLRSMRAKNSAEALFVSGRSGRPHTRDGANQTLKTYWLQVRKLAGISNVRIHDLRHSYASLLVNNGMSLAVVGGLLGHASPQITSRYAHLADATLRAATGIVGKVVGGGGG
jgi:integrase